MDSQGLAKKYIADSQNNTQGFAQKQSWIRKENIGFAKKKIMDSQGLAKKIEDSQKKKQGFASRREM